MVYLPCWPNKQVAKLLIKIGHCFFKRHLLLNLYNKFLCLYFPSILNLIFADLRDERKKDMDQGVRRNPQAS